MATLRIFAADHPEASPSTMTAPADVAIALREAGIIYQRWTPLPDIAPEVDPALVLSAYRESIAAVQDQGGYRAVDVVSIAPNDPDRAAKRLKFLPEHTHREDEVRFFAAGGGLFCLHVGEQVLQVSCTVGDLLVVPDGTRHWFDMGANPAFVAIRWFTDPAGWIAQPTGWAEAARFPRLED